MNHHTLSDFRVAHAAVLDHLLAGGVAALVDEGLVALDVLAQDGLRVRAAAGAGSFRRRERLGKWQRRPGRGSSGYAPSSKPIRQPTIGVSGRRDSAPRANARSG